MRYVIPFSIEATSTGPAPDFLLSPNEGAGCTLRLHRGGRPTAPVARDRVERFALLLSGVAHLQTVAEQLPIKVGEAEAAAHQAYAQLHAQEARKKVANLK